MLKKSFDIWEFLADLNFTQHVGGLRTTEELIRQCHISKGKNILDVGCGNGRTSCYLVKKYGCKVVGIDRNEKMIKRAKERAIRYGVDDKIEFKVIDAQYLPFENNIYDAVISESVIVFIKDKQRVINEFARVTKQGGYIGLNEGTFIKENPPPPKELISYLKHHSIDQTDFLTYNIGEKLLKGARLKDISVTINKIDTQCEFKSICNYVGFSDTIAVLFNLLRIYIKSPTQRKIIKTLFLTPDSFKDYIGHGIYVGKK